MPAGRPRKPRALKKLEGTDRSDRANARAPQIEAARLPPAPKDLTALERRAWSTLAKVVDPLKVAAPADVVAFRQMAVSLAMIDRARDELEEYGDLTYEVVTETGTSYRKRPQVEIIATYKTLLGRELAHFGLTPADRERVSRIGEDGAADPLDEFAVGAG